MTRAVAYVRVSTDKQAESGLSLEAQEERLRAYPLVRGDVELVDVVVDAAQSAGDLTRPGMQRVLAMVDGGEVDTVVVTKLDRLTRSVRDLADLLDRFQRSNVSLVSLAESLDTGCASGRLVLNIMVSVSQWEREATSERTREAMRRKRARGEKTGGIVPYGYRSADGRLTPDDAEQGVLREIRRMRDLGYTLRDIADALNERGLRTRNGGLWRHQYIDRIVRAK